MFFTCFCSALHSDWSVAQRWSLVVFTGGHEGPESIGCWWFVAVLHSCRPLGHIQGVQRIRHRCTSCSEWLPRWRCSVLRPLLICDPALRRIKEARRSFQVMHDCPCEVTMFLREEHRITCCILQVFWRAMLPIASSEHLLASSWSNW